jgi:hypothetical protein
MFFELSKIDAQIIKRLDNVEALLKRLPDAIREKIGFGRPAQP